MTTPERAMSLADFIIKNICDHPDDLEVKHVPGEHEDHIIASVCTEDVGRVVGKEGKTVESIRNLVRVVGARGGMRLYFKVEEANPKTND